VFRCESDTPLCQAYQTLIRGVKSSLRSFTEGLNNMREPENPTQTAFEILDLPVALWYKSRASTGLWIWWRHNRTHHEGEPWACPRAALTKQRFTERRQQQASHLPVIGISRSLAASRALAYKGNNDAT